MFQIKKRQGKSPHTFTIICCTDVVVVSSNLRLRMDFLRKNRSLAVVSHELFDHGVEGFVTGFAQVSILSNLEREENR